MAPGENKAIPIWLAFIVCDDVVRDAQTGKATIIGAFANIGSTKFPALHPKLSLYCELTDGRGQTPISIALVQILAESENELGRINITADFADPRLVVPIHLVMQGVVFPAEGEYRFQLYAHGEPLVERRIIVGLVEPT